MSLTKTMIYALTAVLFGCAPGEITPEDDTETDSSERPDQACTSPLTIGLTPSGRTWSTCAEWGAWAETTTPERVADLNPADSPPGATCYTIDVCTVEIGPLLLLGRPVDQLELSIDEGPCDGLYGAWDFQGWTGLTCLGLFESSGVAVEIY